MATSIYPEQHREENFSQQCENYQDPFDQPYETDYQEFSSRPSEQPRINDIRPDSDRYQSERITKRTSKHNNSKTWGKRLYFADHTQSYPQELEDTAKIKLQNFGLVNGVGVNACFLNSIVQALRCNPSFVSAVEAHKDKHYSSGGEGENTCILCIMWRIFKDMKEKSASVEHLRRALDLDENSAEDPFEIFEKIINRLPKDTKQLFALAIGDRSNKGNFVEVAMLDIDFVKFFRKEFKDSLSHFISIFNRNINDSAITRIGDTLALSLDTYGPVALNDYRSDIIDFCKNPMGRTLFEIKFNFISFICSQNYGNIAHYVAFYYLPSDRMWAYCNDMTVEIYSPESCASMILERNFYPKLLFFRKD